jgi:hypothetical protein
MARRVLKQAFLGLAVLLLILRVDARAEGESCKSLSPETVHQICQTLLDLTNTGKLEAHFRKFRLAQPSDNIPDTLLDQQYLDSVLDVDYDQDGTMDRLARVMQPGSCGNSQIYDAAIAARRSTLPPDQCSQFTEANDEALRWANWGRNDQFLFVEGQPVIVTSRSWRAHADIRFASWLSGGFKRPLCAYEPSGEITETPIPSSDRAICDAVAAKRVEVPRWSEAEELTDEARKTLGQIYGIYPDGGARIASVDLDNDGEIELIAQLNLESGAGCGSHHEWYIALTADRMAIAESPLNRTLGNREWGAFYRNPAVETSLLPPIFLLDGKAYLLGTSPADRTGVYSFANGKAELRCEIDRIAQVRIAREYSVGP